MPLKNRCTYLIKKTKRKCKNKCKYENIFCHIHCYNNDIIQMDNGKCCFCNNDCNPFSQACGICSRITSFYMPP